MKVVILNDTHCGARNSSDIFQEYQTKFYEDVFFPYCVKNDIKQVIHLGDYYDHRKYINFKALNNNRNSFLNKLKEYGMMMDIIPGNHDIFYKNTNELNSLKELMGYYINTVNIIMKPTVMTYGKLKMGLIPWINNENYASTMKWINSTKCNVIGAHLELANFEMNKGFKSTHGMDSKAFERFDLVLSGHYHTKSNHDDIHYLGAQMEFFWNDADDPKYFHVLDTDTLELTPVRNPHRMFYKLHWDNGCDVPDYTELEGKFVKVVVTKKDNPYEFDKFIDMVASSNPYELKIAETFDEFTGNNVEDSNISVEDTPTLLDNYIEAVGTELDKDRLKSMVRRIYTEASNLEIV